MSDDSRPDGSMLGLGLTAEDLRQEDLLRMIVRRLAQIELPLTRLANTAELELKLKLIEKNMTLSALVSAEEDLSAPQGRPPVEALAQSPEEIAALDETYERVAQRVGHGNIPLGLDLYAEAAKEAPGNTDEEP